MGGKTGWYNGWMKASEFESARKVSFIITSYSLVGAFLLKGCQKKPPGSERTNCLEVRVVAVDTSNRNDSLWYSMWTSYDLQREDIVTVSGSCKHFF